MTEAAVRVGVAGVGSLGYHHARLLRDLPGAALAGVLDTDGDRAGSVAREFGTRAYTDLGALLSDVDALVVAVPTVEHYAVAGPALDEGVHVLVEKPIAATVEEGVDLLERASAGGALIATGHVERFNPALRACEPFLDNPRFIESHRLAPFAARGTDVAVVLDLMIHDIDLVLGLVHSAVAAVDAVGVPILTPSVDIANARLRFADGAVANITASRVSREKLRKIRIFQPSGYISVDLGTASGEYLRLREGVTLGAFSESAPKLEEIVERVEFQGDGVEPLRAELSSFVAAVRGEGELVVSGADGVRALEIALEIVREIEAAMASGLRG